MPGNHNEIEKRRAKTKSCFLTRGNLRGALLRMLRSCWRLSDKDSDMYHTDMGPNVRLQINLQIVNILFMNRKQKVYSL